MKKIMLLSLILFSINGYANNIRIFTDPTHSMVFVDELLVGTTPLKNDDLSLSNGVYKLQIVKENHKRINVQLKVMKDMVLVFNLEKEVLTVEEQRKLLEQLITKEEKIIIIK